MCAFCQIYVESCNEKRHLCGETGDVNVYIVELMYEFRTLLVKKKIMLTCALRAYFKVSKGRKLYLIAQKNLMFKMYNAQFIREYYYICTLNNVNISLKKIVSVGSSDSN
jgi:hypothetical protein